MKQRIGFIAVGLVAAVVAVFIYANVRRPSDQQLEQPLEHWPEREGQFPELKPVIQVPDGYDLAFSDGPDFYTWVLAEREKIGKRHRSGIGIYFGHHPDRSKGKDATEQLAGKVCSQPVTWLVTRNDDPDDTWIVHDAFLKHNHGPEFRTIMLHVWVWGQSREQVERLTKRIEDLSFVTRKQ